MRGSACLCLVLVTAPLFAAELSQFNTCTDRRSMDQLAVVAKKLVTPGHGILAADESISTVGKRLASINVDNSEANRAALRHMLFTSQGKSASVDASFSSTRSAQLSGFNDMFSGLCCLLLSQSPRETATSYTMACSQAMWRLRSSYPACAACTCCLS